MFKTMHGQTLMAQQLIKGLILTYILSRETSESITKKFNYEQRYVKHIEIEG